MILVIHLLLPLETILGVNVTSDGNTIQKIYDYLIIKTYLIKYNGTFVFLVVHFYLFYYYIYFIYHLFII